VPAPSFAQFFAFAKDTASLREKIAHATGGTEKLMTSETSLQRRR